MSFFNSPFMVSLALLLLSMSNLAMIYSFHELAKSVDILRLCVISDRSIAQMLIDSKSLTIATPSNQTCQ